MTDETDTSAFAETDSVTPEQTDTGATEWTYYDPDEDEPDTEEVQEEAATDDGIEQSEDDDPEDDADEAEAEGSEDQAAEPVKVKLPDGTEVEQEEVVKGYLRQQDYSRKTQALAEERKGFQSSVQRLEQIQEAFIDQISAMVPKAPDPSLAYSDPNAYTRAKAAHEAAMAQVERIVQLGQQPREMRSEMDEKAQREWAADQDRLLAERFPEVSKPDTRKQFFQDAISAARHAGFSDQEIGGFHDHRVLALAKMAADGMKAKQSTEKARKKVEKAPPVTPRKSAGRNRNRNAEAMKKLTKSGSIRDALAIDFD